MKLDNKLSSDFLDSFDVGSTVTSVRTTNATLSVASLFDSFFRSKERAEADKDEKKSDE